MPLHTQFRAWDRKISQVVKKKLREGCPATLAQLSMVDDQFTISLRLSTLPLSKVI
jgi:hypothetical protein